MANATRVEIAWEIIKEYDRAISKFPPMKSPHEGIAILREEYLELEAEVFKQHHTRTKEAMRKEAIQVAAMALRFIIDCTTEEKDATEHG